MKKSIISLHVLALLGFLALLSVNAELSRQAKYIAECLVVGQMAVQPSLEESPTNSFTAYAKDGTNYFGFDPTNAAPRMGIGGTNAVGATATIAFSGTNLVFIKGILTRVGP